MKKLLTVSLYVLAGVTLGIFVLGISLHVRAGAPVGATYNGDVNGDGTIDISDAVYTLLYLFKGGKAPVACSDRPELLEHVAELEGNLASVRAELETCHAALPPPPVYDVIGLVLQRNFFDPPSGLLQP